MLAVLLALAGCTGGYRAGAGTAYEGVDEGKLVAEAFRFNSRVYRDGKPTTFRTEIYLADTVIGLAGTGYFGKGAFRGSITADSIELYFPHSNEYVLAAMTDLLFSAPCDGVASRLEPRALLTRLPAELELGETARIEPEDTDGDRRRYVVTWTGCPWRFDLTYDRRRPGWRLRQLRFNDGASFEVVLRYDRYKDRAEIKNHKFQPRVPADAVRIEP